MSSPIGIDTGEKSRAARLRAWCAVHEDRPVLWGVDDCTSFAARWVERETGQSVARATFNSQEQAKRLMAEAGGLERLWRDCMAQSGFAETGLPAQGDVGLVHTDRYGPVGVIFTIEQIAIWRTLTGVRLFKPRGFVCAFRIPDRS